MQEIQRAGLPQGLDIVRRKYLASIKTHNGDRNVIAYYSGWQHKPDSRDAQINDKDKQGFMLTIHGMDRSKGLDLILHTPGGELGATESIVDYLYLMFGKDIRVIVPQISMSAGTMIAMAAKQIIMGKHSNLGPIDPQMGGLACESVLEEFENAKKDVKANPQATPLWQVIIAKYHPTFLSECKHAINWSKKMAREWLKYNMWAGDSRKVQKVLDMFASHTRQMSHSRHISCSQCAKVLNVLSLESDQNLQDAVLTTHHAFMHTLGSTSVVKIIENHLGIAYIEAVRRDGPQPQQSQP